MQPYTEEQIRENVTRQYADARREAIRKSIEEKRWLRAALKECLAYHEHGVETETTEDGTTICLNCSNVI